MAIPSLKRKAETVELPSQPPPKKPATVAPEDPVDLSFLFSSIVVNVQQQPPMAPHVIAEVLSQSEGILQPIQQLSFVKINGLFETHLQTIEHPQIIKDSAFEVLTRLYESSLLNSSTKDTLVSTAEKLPQLQAKLQGNIKAQIAADLHTAQKLFEEAKSCEGLAKIQQFIPKVDALLSKLNEHRMLKHYQDVEENNRICDLALYYKNKQWDQQYPKILSDYPNLVTQIGQLGPELESVSKTIQQFSRLRLELQKTQSTLTVREKVDPLQTRFLDPFSKPLYDAFALHFLNIAWNSSAEPAMAKVLKTIPNWNKPNSKEIDYPIFNALWGACFSEHSLSQWILKTLASMGEGRLLELEKKLQALEKSINEYQVLDLDQETRTQILTSLKNEMKEECLTATHPSYSTIKEFRKFLTS